MQGGRKEIRKINNSIKRIQQQQQQQRQFVEQCTTALRCAFLPVLSFNDINKKEGQKRKKKLKVSTTKNNEKSINKKANHHIHNHNHNAFSFLLNRCAREEDDNTMPIETRLHYTTCKLACCLLLLNLCEICKYTVNKKLH